MKKKILVVDDETEFADAIKMRLEAHDYDVITACDGREGIDKAKKEKPGIILLDLVMPNLDGISTLAQLKDNPSTERIPVVVITAKAETEYALDAGKLGAADYIVKPVDMQILVDMVRKYIL
jgi:adenylate cyclase